MTVHVELPASMSEDDMPEGWFRHIEPGMRDTVDRLVAQLQGYERPMISMR
jgi:hypothetical protein